jgi:glycosyltransferase involved in cell wall biosynthesis
VVVDCDSSDGTGKVARRFGARVFRRRNEPNIHLNTSFALAKARGPWLLNLDPDEIVPPALRREILAAIRDPKAPSAFEMPRRNFYFGRWLRRGGKYPDRVRRLYRKGHARFANRHVHEKITVAGPVGRLRHPLDHHPYPDLDAYLRKLRFYATFEANRLRAAGVRPSLPRAISWCLLRPGRRFLSRYVMKLGMLDGLPGFLACVHDWLTHVLTYARLALPR